MKAGREVIVDPQTNKTDLSVLRRSETCSYQEKGENIQLKIVAS